QLFHEYNLYFGTSRVTSGTIRECDPLRKNAKDIADVLKGEKAATLTLDGELHGLSIGSYVPDIMLSESIDLSAGPNEEKIYDQLNTMSEEIVDRILTLAKQDQRLLNALNAPKRFSMPNCGIS
ncbi:MAG TPA: hypothetical protein PLF01_04750, partial [Alphaproteobacteria bacterium]|nr:hypothetical protein [Alphaproteobacteria bacterium]